MTESSPPLALRLPTLPRVPGRGFFFCPYPLMQRSGRAWPSQKAPYPPVRRRAWGAGIAPSFPGMPGAGGSGRALPSRENALHSVVALPVRTGGSGRAKLAQELPFFYQSCG